MSTDNNISSTLPKQGVSLSAYSADDKPWDTHRKESQEVEKILSLYEDDAWLRRLRDRMYQCSPWLIFSHSATPDERGKTFRLHETTFCRVRGCPVCQWRRSLRHTARFLEMLPSLLKDHPRHKWVFLTLTVKNCNVNDLRPTIKDLGRAWQRLSQRQEFRNAVKGYVKNIEVTRSADGSAHPHLHVLLFVPDGYFKKKEMYITQARWTELWQDALRVDYSPVVNVKGLRGDVEDAAREVLKYATKPEDLTADADWLVRYLRQVHNLRFLSAGGIIKDYLSTEEPDEDEMIVPGQEDVVDDSNIVALTRFDWRRAEKGYFATETKTRPIEESVPAEKEPWEEWASEPVRRGDWEAQKKAYDDKRAKELLDEIRQDTGGTLEGLLRATGNSWAMDQAFERRGILNELARERRRRKTP